MGIVKKLTFCEDLEKIKITPKDDAEPYGVTITR